MESVLNAVLTALQEAGIPAVMAVHQGVMPRLTTPKAAVSLEKVRAANGSFYDYLGLEETEDRGLVERYGRKMEATLLISVFSPDCRDVTGDIYPVLAAGFPGVTVGEMTADKPEFDAAADCWITSLRAELCAYLYAESQDDDEEFLEFTLEGELK